jgi:hypothetical protein
MEIYWRVGSLAWGLSLIGLTMAIHAMSVVTMALVGVRIRVRLETRRLGLWHAVSILIGVVGISGLLLAARAQALYWQVVSFRKFRILTTRSARRSGQMQARSLARKRGVYSHVDEVKRRLLLLLPDVVDRRIDSRCRDH